MYIAQLLSLIFRMHIRQEAQAYDVVALMFLLSFVDRRYIVVYLGPAEGARLRLRLLGLALPPVRDHRVQQAVRAPALLRLRRHHPHNPHPVLVETPTRNFGCEGIPSTKTPLLIRR